MKQQKCSLVQFSHIIQGDVIYNKKINNFQYSFKINKDTKKLPKVSHQNTCEKGLERDETGLTAVADLPEDMGSTVETQKMAPNHLLTPVPGDLSPPTGNLGH